MSGANDKIVTVVGAGFSGLVTAFYLVREGFTVRVIEARSKPGGLIQTVIDDYGLTETAANGILNTAAFEDVLRAIGVSVLPTLEGSRRRFIFRRGRARRWPIGLNATLRVAMFLLFKPFISWYRPQPLETVRDWGNRVVGREATEYGIEPALQGIYAGDPTRLSARLLFAKFFDRTRRRKPSVRGTISAARGMGEIIEKLRAYLEAKEVQFEFDSVFSFAEKYPPRTPVVIATAAPAAARFLAPLDPERAGLIAGIEMLPLLSATVFFEWPTDEAQGFGCLFPPREKRAALGVLMNDFIFSGRATQGASETWIFGGANTVSAEILNLNDAEVLKAIERERRECFRADSRLQHARITRWPVALPHYTVDLEKRLPEVQRNRFNIFLIGNYLGEIGLSRIVDKARETALQVTAAGEWDT